MLVTWASEHEQGKTVNIEGQDDSRKGRANTCGDLRELPGRSAQAYSCSESVSDEMPCSAHDLQEHG